MVDAPSDNYSKKSPFMWIVIYVLIGLIVYGAIYYFAFYKKSGNKAYETPVQEENVDTSENMENQEETRLSDEISVEDVVVTLTNTGFEPAEVNIAPGTAVIWVNQSGKTATVNSSPHPQHTDYDPLNLDQFKDGESLSFTFDAPGTYKYHDHLNSSHFGTVIVE